MLKHVAEFYFEYQFIYARNIPMKFIYMQKISGMLAKYSSTLIDVLKNHTRYGFHTHCAGISDIFHSFSNFAGHAYAM